MEINRQKKKNLALKQQRESNKKKHIENIKKANSVQAHQIKKQRMEHLYTKQKFKEEVVEENRMKSNAVKQVHKNQ